MSGFWRGGTGPRPRVERIGALDEALRSISPRPAKAFLAWVLYGASAEAIGEKLGVTPDKARYLIGYGASLLRHPSRAVTLRDYLDTNGRTLLIDEGLRALLREWQLEEMFALECSQCGHRYTPDVLRGLRLEYGGRPRRYCSNACRQKAYRERHR